MRQAKIYVGNLSYETSSTHLQDHFSQYGKIAEIKLITDRETGRSKGFAFITFDDAQAAQSALAANGAEFDGRKLKVNIANDDDRSKGGSGGGRGGFGGGSRPQGNNRW